MRYLTLLTTICLLAACAGDPMDLGPHAGPDGAVSTADAAPAPDGRVGADAGSRPDGMVEGPDAVVPDPDVAPPEPDVALPEPDAGASEPDAAPEPDAEPDADPPPIPPDDGPPIGPHARNPIWLDDGTGRAVALVGISHGWELQDDAWSAQYTLDWGAWLDHLVEHDFNYSRLWRVESAQQTADDPHRATPMPYARTGPGRAADGGLRYDLDRFDDAWFERLRARAETAGERGIYVSVMFFERHSTYSTRGEAFPWAGHPFAAANNLGGLDGDLDGDGQGREVFRLPDEGGSAVVLARQEAFVRRTIDALNDLDNVMYEICNECQPDSHRWQLHLIEVARDHMDRLPQQQMVGYTGPGRADDGGWPDFDLQLDSPADFVSPRDVGVYRDDPPANTTDRVIFADSDHIDPYGRDAVWVWKSFLRGLHPQALEGHDILPPDPPRRSAERDAAVRGALGWITRVGDLVDLSRMRPRNGRCSTRYCLVHPGQSYLVLAPDGGAFTVDLADIDGPAAITWLEVETNEIMDGGAVLGGGDAEIEAPFAGAAVAFLRPGGQVEPPPAFCPDVDDGIVWRRAAAFTSTEAAPTFEASIPTPDGAIYGRLEVDFDLHVGPWYAPDPTGTHSLFQIQRGQWRSNLFGFITAFGPGRNEVKVISNIDLPAGDVLRLNRRNVRLEPGRDYHVRYVYDAAGGVRSLEVTEGDAQVVRMQDDQVVETVTMRRSLDLILGGDLNPNGPEVPTFDWRFSNVCVRVRVLR